MIQTHFGTSYHAISLIAFHLHFSGNYFSSLEVSSKSKWDYFPIGIQDFSQDINSVWIIGH